MPEAELEYSLNEVKRAGKILRDQEPGSQEYGDALAVFANWRQCHSVPLNQFYEVLQQYARLTSMGAPVASVVHRPKRVEAVIAKLRRDHNAQLSTMHDIAGCRVIVRAVRDVATVIEACRFMFARHKLGHVYPYIERPNLKTGYRGVHLVYSFQSEHKAFNGRLIEIQIRTSAQHAWATTVETVDLIQKQSLKSGHGDARWQRFFTLMSSAIAVRESCPIVPGTPADRVALEDELRRYEDMLQVYRHLGFYSSFARTIGRRYEGMERVQHQESKRLKFFLMQLSVESRELSVAAYREHEVQEAYRDVAEAERAGKNVVLAGAEDFAHLKEAYPNWFVDTFNFLKILEATLGEDVAISKTKRPGSGLPPA